MRFIKLTCSVAALGLLLSGCAGGEKLERRHPREQEVRIETAPVIVATGCVGAAGKPAKPTTLRQKYPEAEWFAKPPGAKASAVQVQVGERLNYETKLDAATAGCE